jgi:hypothetical protein
VGAPERRVVSASFCSALVPNLQSPLQFQSIRKFVAAADMPAVRKPAARILRRADNKKDPGATAKEFQAQWHNPKEVIAVLLIIGGEIVQKALAQLSAGRGYIVPVAFSFGWVAYAFSTIVSLVGDCRLMPEPDYHCKVFNVENGFVRENRSWVLGRLLRDSEPVLDRQSLRIDVFTTKRRATRSQLQGHPRWGWSFPLGLVVMIVQLVVAAIPCFLYYDWGILLITGAGTLLAIFTGLLPQWKAEKYGCRTNTHKVAAITAGNGSRYVMVIFGRGRGLDLEDLAGGEGPRMKRLWEKCGLFTKKVLVPPQEPLPSHSPDHHQQAHQRGTPGAENEGKADENKDGESDGESDGVSSDISERKLSKRDRDAQPTTEYTVSTFYSLPLDLWMTRVICLALAVAWTALLIAVAALEENAWFLLAVGGIGMAQNAVLAGMPRQSSKRGIHLRKIWTEETGKVMDVIMDIESAYPGRNIGPTLREEFFPGKMTRQAEIEWWKEGGDKGLYDNVRIKERNARGVPLSKRPKSLRHYPMAYLEEHPLYLRWLDERLPAKPGPGPETTPP